VAADFEVSSLLEILAASRLNFQAPAFFACLGVLVYLAAPAVEAIFRLVTSFPRGSEIVFTIAQPGEHSLAQDAAAVGEPWLSFHDPVLLASQLTAAGFSEVYFLDPETARERYYQDRTDALPPPRRVTIGRTVV
jgi:O-methyltransferase involved in polyketide biosynthesis